MFAIESALFFSVNRNIVSFQATQSSMMLKSFSFLLFHFTCNNATGEWRLVELNRAHFRRMREEVDYPSDYLYPFTLLTAGATDIIGTFSPLPALIFFDSHPLLFWTPCKKNTEHRYECDNKRWVNWCLLVSGLCVCVCLC